MKCPNCGAIINVEVPRKKGTGKKTGTQQTRLSEKQMWTLDILLRLEATDLVTALPRQKVYEQMRDEAIAQNTRIPSSHIVGFWLSALLGAGFVSMANIKCEMKDFDTRNIRFKIKPVWYLSRDFLNGKLTILEGRLIKKES